MKTCEDVLREYDIETNKFTEEGDTKAHTNKDGSYRDREKETSVTDLCVMEAYCEKNVYYNKICKRPIRPSSQRRMLMGTIVHEIPLWIDGHELGFTYEGLRCRMDEIHINEGIIIDKKTALHLPTIPNKYVTAQLNMYKVIAEENKERPIKINKLMVLTICVIDGKTNCLEVPIWPVEKTKKFMKEKYDRLWTNVNNKTPPNIQYGSAGWFCDSCQYVQECKESSKGQQSSKPKESSPKVNVKVSHF